MSDEELFDDVSSNLSDSTAPAAATNSDFSDLESASETIVSRVRTRRLPYKLKKNLKGESELHVACIENKLQRVQMLVEKGHPLDVKDNLGWTPLHEAVNNGALECCQYLLKNGADINIKGPCHYTPLLDATESGNFAAVRLLLKHGCDVTVTSRKCEDALHLLDRHYEQYKDTAAPREIKDYKHLRNEILEKMRLANFKHSENIGQTSETSNRKSTGPKIVKKHTPALSDCSSDDDTVSATKQYQSAINVARLTVLREKKQAKESRQKCAEETALVDSAAIACDDDWLEDDLGIFSKRSSTGNRDRSNIPSKKQKKGRSHEDCPKRLKSSFSVASLSSDVTDLFDSEAQAMDTHDVFPSCSSSSTSNSNDSRKATGRSRRFNEESDGEMVFLNRPRSAVVSVGAQQQVVPRTPTSTKGGVISVKLKLEERVVWITVREGDKVDKIKQLALKLYSEMHRDTVLCPVIKLLKESAELCDEDEALLHVNPNDVIIAETSLPSTTPADAYRSACSNLQLRLKQHVRPFDDIVLRLENCTLSDTLDLSSLNLDDNLVRPILESVTVSSKIQVLNLYATDLRKLGDVLGKVVFANRSSLRILNLSQTSLRACDMEHFVKQLDDPGVSLMVLRELDLSFTFMGDRSASCFARFLALTPNLTHLRLNDVGLSQKFFEDCYDQLRGLSYLTSVEAAYNTLRSDGTKILLNLATPEKLTVLNLSGCSVDSDDCGIALEAIHSFTSKDSCVLTTLILNQFHLSPYHFSFLCQRVLPLLKNLRKLEVSENQALDNSDLRCLLVEGFTISRHSCLKDITLINCSLALPFDACVLGLLRNLSNVFGLCLRFSFIGCSSEVSLSEEIMNLKDELQKMSSCFQIKSNLSAGLVTLTVSHM